MKAARHICWLSLCCLLGSDLLRLLLNLNFTYTLPDDVQRLVIQPAASLRIVCSIIFRFLVLQNVNIGDVGQTPGEPCLVVPWTV